MIQKNNHDAAQVGFAWGQIICLHFPSSATLMLPWKLVYSNISQIRNSVSNMERSLNHRSKPTPPKFDHLIEGKSFIILEKGVYLNRKVYLCCFQFFLSSRFLLCLFVLGSQVFSKTFHSIDLRGVGPEIILGLCESCMGNTTSDGLSKTETRSNTMNTICTSRLIVHDYILKKQWRCCLPCSLLHCAPTPVFASNWL